MLPSDVTNKVGNATSLESTYRMVLRSDGFVEFVFALLLDGGPEPSAFGGLVVPRQLLQKPATLTAILSESYRVWVRGWTQGAAIPKAPNPGGTRMAFDDKNRDTAALEKTLLENFETWVAYRVTKTRQPPTFEEEVEDE